MIALSARDKLVRHARYLVRKQIQAGELKPIEQCECADCGAPAWCYDHRDYYQPLIVEPVCQACNNRRGPGLPHPTDADGREHKLDREKAVGIRWACLESGGEGYDPLYARLAVDVDLSLTNSEDIIGATFQSSHRIIDGFSNHTWTSRFNYFKEHDPWYA